MVIRAQAAIISAPSHVGATAVIGTQYRVINNNSIIAATYTGFQPTDLSFPVLQNTLGSATLGAPNTLINNQPSTGNINVTGDGFTLLYDYLPTGAGTDTLTFNNVAFTDSLVITEVWPTLVATGSIVAVNVSEYTVTQTLALPVAISGGDSPYTINVTGVSDSRFVVINNGSATAALQLTVAQFTPGSTYNCTISMVVSDSASPTNTVIVTGAVLQVTIQVQNYITVAFSNYTWSINRGSEPQVGSIVLNSLMSTPQLGHPPYTYNVTSVTIPGGLGSFIQNSPTKRVLAFNLNETSTPASVADENGSLVPTGFYTVAATNFASSPSVGTYTITVGLQVVDSKGITSSATKSVTVIIS
jgi:hypothetical protein